MHPLNSPSLTATHDDALYALCRSLCSSTACCFFCLMQMPNNWLRMMRFTLLLDLMQPGSVVALVACGFPCMMQMPNNWLRVMRFTPFPRITIPLLFYCPDGITTVLLGHCVGGIFIDAQTSWSSLMTLPCPPWTGCCWGI